MRSYRNLRPEVKACMRHNTSAWFVSYLDSSPSGHPLFSSSSAASLQYVIEGSSILVCSSVLPFLQHCFLLHYLYEFKAASRQPNPLKWEVRTEGCAVNGFVSFGVFPSSPHDNALALAVLIYTQGQVLDTRTFTCNALTGNAIAHFICHCAECTGVADCSNCAPVCSVALLLGTQHSLPATMVVL